MILAYISLSAALDTSILGLILAYCLSLNEYPVSI